jgi:hypothetical protein
MSTDANSSETNSKDNKLKKEDEICDDWEQLDQTVRPLLTFVSCKESEFLNRDFFSSKSKEAFNQSKFPN